MLDPTEISRICTYVFFALTVFTIIIFSIGVYLEYKRNKEVRF